MKKLIAIFALLILGYGVVAFLDYIEQVRRTNPRTGPINAQAVPDPYSSGPQGMTALPPQLEASLQVAQRQGAAGLGQWLRQFRTHVQDPRLAEIELDYVVLITRDNPAEARRIFRGIKARTPRTSPVFPRLQRLEKTYE